jgi:hypothetical protein
LREIGVDTMQEQPREKLSRMEVKMRKRLKLELMQMGEDRNSRSRGPGGV